MYGESQSIDYYLILRHYCDLNTIPYHSSRDAVLDFMIRYPDATIAYRTPYARLFDLMYQLIRGTINLETMMMSGDIDHPLHTFTHSTAANCLVVDSVAFSASQLSNDTIIYIK